MCVTVVIVHFRILVATGVLWMKKNALLLSGSTSKVDPFPRSRYESAGGSLKFTGLTYAQVTMDSALQDTSTANWITPDGARRMLGLDLSSGCNRGCRRNAFEGGRGGRHLAIARSMHPSSGRETCPPPTRFCPRIISRRFYRFLIHHISHKCLLCT